MKKLLPILMAAVLLGCTSVDPDANTFVVQSERTINYATEIVDTFLRWEHENRTFLAETGATEAADQLRLEFPALHTEATRLVRAYKVSRSQPDYHAALTAIELLNAAAKVAARYLAPTTPQQP